MPTWVPTLKHYSLLTLDCLTRDSVFYMTLQLLIITSATDIMTTQDAHTCSCMLMYAHAMPNAYMYTRALCWLLKARDYISS